MTNEELFEEFVRDQPDFVILSCGIADLKLENISWRNEIFPKLFYHQVLQVLNRFKDVAKQAGTRGDF